VNYIIERNEKFMVACVAHIAYGMWGQAFCYPHFMLHEKRGKRLGKTTTGGGTERRLADCADRRQAVFSG
jgi:hypothetical protein